ncbi:MAG: helix-turn-helix domain-containing protein [Chloroflexi bacterium]|nr:helix-turn-helix domain-containing protein [Chloroflexota bacterium]
MPDSTEARCKTIGLLIRRARETTGHTRKDCAAFVGISSTLMSRYEEGLREPSLVELEALAHYLRVPVEALVDEATSAQMVTPRMDFDMSEVMALRTHIIGTRLKQARLKTNQSLKQLAEAVGMSPSRLNAYELGKRPVPITELQRLIACLDLSLDALLDLGIGPLGEAQLRHKQQAYVDGLPDDVRAFVTDPCALPFLRLAIHLHKLPGEELRNAGRALLELSETTQEEDTRS